MDASVLDETMPKTDITGACLHGKAGYQQSERRRRYRAPYLIGRPCRDHERHRSPEGHRAGKGQRGGVQEKVKPAVGRGGTWHISCQLPYLPLLCPTISAVAQSMRPVASITRWMMNESLYVYI